MCTKLQIINQLKHKYDYVVCNHLVYNLLCYIYKDVRTIKQNVVMQSKEAMLQ